MKPCRCCGQLLPLAAFYARGDNHGDGRKNTCVNCINGQQRARRKQARKQRTITVYVQVPCACPHCTPAITDPNERLVAWYEAQAVAA